MTIHIALKRTGTLVRWTPESDIATTVAWYCTNGVVSVLLGNSGVYV
jgi:hypothetical protein